MDGITYQSERVKDLWPEILAIATRHYAELAHFKDIPFDLDQHKYNVLDEAGLLRLHTARDREWRLMGYTSLIVSPNIHYRTSLQAMQDVVFMLPEFRYGAIGSRLIAFSDRQLEAEGVQVVYRNTAEELDFSAVLKHLGYQPVERLFARRLDQGASHG
jgi:hypothetical protein